MSRAPSRPRRPGAIAPHEICDFVGTPEGAKACVKGPGASSSRIFNALLVAPPFPWLRPSIARIRSGPRARDTLVAAVAGRTYPAVKIEIDGDRVAAFAAAIGADPDHGVPPTFAPVYALGVTAPQLFGGEGGAVDFARLLHAEQEFE